MTYGGVKYPVIPSHFSSLLDPQIQWWSGCEFEIPHEADLVQEWNTLDALITMKSGAYPDAVRNARQPEDNMTEVYRTLRNTMDGRLHEIFTQPNYGRGVPVVICGSELSGPTMDLLAHRVQIFERDDLHKHNLSVLQQLNDVTLVQSYQKHTSKAADFLKLISEETEGTQG
eukprot:2851239-Amphidinium_carterae.1